MIDLIYNARTNHPDERALERESPQSATLHSTRSARTRIVRNTKETMDASAIERAIDAVSSLDELARVRFTRRSRLRSRKTVEKERVDVIQRRRED